MMGQCVRPQQQQEERFAVSLVDWIGPVMTARRALGGRRWYLGSYCGGDGDMALSGSPISSPFRRPVEEGREEEGGAGCSRLVPGELLVLATGRMSRCCRWRWTETAGIAGPLCPRLAHPGFLPLA